MKKTVAVKKCKLGFGICYGDKWYAFAYDTEEKAQFIANKLTTPERIAVNCSYHEPLSLAIINDS